MKTTTLYRPVGLREMELIAEAKYIAFPPRLEWQPIFYPVLHQTYAEQIAEQWNVPDSFSGYCGLVTSFDVNKEMIKQYDVKNVGGALHEELWIPAEELEQFNYHINGTIEIVSAYLGKEYRESENIELNAKINQAVKNRMNNG